MFNYEHTLHSLRKRISAFIIAISFLFCGLLIRLIYVQVFEGNSLQAKAYSQWTRDLPITAERGKIYDSNGATLAVSFTTYDVYVRGREIKNKTEVSKFLSTTLNMDYEKTLYKVSLTNVSEVLVKLQVNELKAKTILEKNYKGVFLTESIKRYYPYGDLLTQILGFTTVDNVGQSGLESYFNDILKGTDGSYVVQSDLQGKEIENAQRTYLSGVAGNNINLTINVNIQLALEQVLNQIMQEQLPKSVTAIIMNAKTGGIVASSTKPSFDLNNIPRDNVSLLMDEVKNKIAVDVYEPGSTFKILTMSSAIEEGVAQLSNHFYCPGYRVVDGQKIKCWKTTGHGSLDLTNGLVNSCNCVFMDLAQRLGTQTFYSYLSKFGLGSTTGIEISGESKGIMLKSSQVKNVDLARIGFGQTIAVTPLQLITAVCAAVNGGNLLQPTLISKICDSENNLVSEQVKILKNKVISENTSKTLNEMLKKVVNKKTEYSFIEGYDVGGKTGTAQKYENGSIARGKYISSFIGTYPASDPEYVLLLLVDEPGAGSYYGSVVAAPYAKLILSKMFSVINASRATNQEIILKKISMPNLVGLSLTVACSELSKLGLSYEIDGEGGVVIKQLPPAGIQVDENDTIILVT